MTKRQLDVVGTRSRPAGGGGPRGSANADGRVARAAVRSVGVLLALVLSLSVAIIGQDMNHRRWNNQTVGAACRTARRFGR